MKQFKNLVEALKYHTSCPFCSGKMVTDMDMVLDENSMKAYLKFGASKVVVDCATNDIIQHEESSIHDVNYKTYSGAPIRQYMGPIGNNLLPNGLNYRRVNVSCDDCLRYSYLVQILVSLSDKKIIGLFLNSETVSVEDSAKLYEVKTIYATEKTEMSTFHTHVSKQRGALDKVDIPLVPMDLQNPMKTVERIKKLIVFL